MYILIGGGGVVGTVMAKALCDRKHNVVVVDPNPETCAILYAETGAVTVNGSATDIRTLQEAGAEKADVAIACMHRDPDNMSFSLLARSLGVPHIVAKMRDPHYRVAFEAAGVNFVCDIITMLMDEVLANLEQVQEKMTV